MIFKVMLMMLHLTQIVFAVPIGKKDLNNGDGGIERHAASFNWTFTDFSECSASCDGGLRIRSVRCLNDDGIISEDCSIGSKPKNYEFCNQIDCTTNTPNNNLLPGSATFIFLGDFNTILEFDIQGPNSYTITLNHTEPDTTVTSITEIVSPGGIQTCITIYGASTAVDIILSVDEEDILSFNSSVKINIRSTQSLAYQNNRVSIIDIKGNSFVDGISTLHYYDGLKFYKFNKDIVNVLEGSGNLYYTPGRGIAVYSINRDLNTKLDREIASSSIISSRDVAQSSEATSTITDQNADQPDRDMCDEENLETSTKDSTSHSGRRSDTSSRSKSCDNSRSVSDSLKRSQSRSHHHHSDSRHHHDSNVHSDSHHRHSDSHHSHSDSSHHHSNTKHNHVSPPDNSQNSAEQNCISYL